MKKIITILVVAIVALTASAQKGMMGVGADIQGLISTERDRLDNGILMKHTPVFGVDIKFQYNVSNYYRIQPYAGVAFGGVGTEITAGIANHIFFSRPQKTRLYFIGSLAYGSMPTQFKLSDEDFKEVLGEVEATDTHSTLLLEVGLGLNQRLSHNLSFQVEATCVMSPFKKDYHTWGDKTEFGVYGARVKVGVTYDF